MAKTNVILFNSVLWNLREIAKLEEKIKKQSGDVECASWRYPLIDCSQLEVFKLIENNKNADDYTFILELTYDRLLYMLNLMIKYLESEDLSEKFRPGKGVVRPKTLSLASVLQMLWDRIQIRRENSFSAVPGNEKTKSDVFGSKTSSETQSEFSCLSNCSSCCMVQEFVTSLVLEMEKISEKQDFSSAIVEERKLMNERLLETTNWSAMSRWLGAITKDFSAILEKAEEAAVASRKLKRRFESNEQSTKTKLEALEEETRKLGGLLKVRDLRILEMKQEINDSTSEKNRMAHEMAEKNLQLAKSTSDLEQKIVEMKKKYEDRIVKIKENHAKKQREKEIEWKKTLECEKRFRTSLEVELKELGNSVKELENSVKEAQEKLEEANSKSAETANILMSVESENECLRAENRDLRESIEAKKKTIEEFSSRMMEAFPELNRDSQPDYKASGNPRIDMENQIEANKLRIELLMKENEKFESILEKLKGMEMES